MSTLILPIWLFWGSYVLDLARNMTPSGKAGGSQGVIYADRASLDAAADLLWRFDPELHHLEDYALTIAETIVGVPCLRGGKT